MSNKTIMGVTLAATAALAFAFVPAASFAKAKKVECKAKDGTMHMVKSAKSCTKKGGTVVEKAMEAPAATEAAPAAPAPATTETPAS